MSDMSNQIELDWLNKRPKRFSALRKGLDIHGDVFASQELHEDIISNELLT
jgi:hypothetical protein